MDLRALVEKDLQTTLEGDYAGRVNLISPDGVKYTVFIDDRPLVGQVLYNTVREGESFGTIGKIVLDTPVVTLRRSSLIRIPLAGEKWLVEIPASPLPGAPFVQYVFSSSRPPEGGAAIGFIRLYLQAVEQLPVLDSEAINEAIANGSVTVTSDGIVIKSANGTEWKIAPDDDGNIISSDALNEAIARGAITITPSGLVIKSPNGTQWKIAPDDAGNLTATSL